MPLSEHEQRMLEQMERALYAEDPKFATALEGSGLRTYTRRRVYQAVAGFLEQGPEHRPPRPGLGAVSVSVVGPDVVAILVPFSAETDRR